MTWAKQEGLSLEYIYTMCLSTSAHFQWHLKANNQMTVNIYNVQQDNSWILKQFSYKKKEKIKI